MQGLVTVFGGTGFIGTQVVRELARQGWRVRVAVRNPGRGYRLRMLGDVGQIQIVQANVRNEDSVGRALDGAEACVNLVGLLFQGGKQTFSSAHAEGAETIARACKTRKITNFVQMSALGADPDSDSLYWRTKAEGEAAVRRLIPGAVVVRPSVVFGPGDDFFNRFGAMAVMSPVLPLVGGGETKFQPVYVGDVADAIAKALKDPACAGHTYELGGPTVYSFRELMELICEVTLRKRILAPVPWPIAGLIGVAGDIQASAKGVIGLIPAPPLTSDQVKQLRHDNVVGESASGLAQLGISPQAAEPILPTYMVRYRKGGEFAEVPASA